MKVDPYNLQLKLVRGRTKTVFLQIGNWTPTPPAPAGQTIWNWVPTDISTWIFAFTMRSNYTLKQPNISLAYNPIVNAGDPTQGILQWNILFSDTEPLTPGNYVFDMRVIQGDNIPRFFCGGTVPLLDNVTDLIVTPSIPVRIGMSLVAKPS